MNNVFIAVVSHGHYDIIKSLDVLTKLSQCYKVIVKLNKNEGELQEYLTEKKIECINERHNMGFGANNNYIYKHCKLKYNIKDDDIFIVLNPDLSVDFNCIEELAKRMNDNNVNLASINLFKDYEFNNYDNNIRKFPNLLTFIKSFSGLGNDSIIDKSSVKQATDVDWSAGSFLAFKSAHYEKLKGFDERYFMYCEDIDICYRSYISGNPLRFFPDIRAVHLAKHANRSLFSKHFYWHVKSALRFLSVSR